MRALHGGERPRARPEGIFVRRQLDDVGEAELALQFFDGLAGHVRRQRPHVVDGELARVRMSIGRHVSNPRESARGCSRKIDTAIGLDPKHPA